MYYNSLDITFFYLANGEAVYTYSGYADNRDANDEHILNAFRKANEMRIVMEETLKQVHKAFENEKN